MEGCSGKGVSEKKGALHAGIDLHTNVDVVRGVVADSEAYCAGFTSTFRMSLQVLGICITYTMLRTLALNISRPSTCIDPSFEG